MSKKETDLFYSHRGYIEHRGSVVWGDRVNTNLSLSDPHEIKLPMAEHQAAHGVLTKRPSWPPE